MLAPLPKLTDNKHGVVSNPTLAAASKEQQQKLKGLTSHAKGAKNWSPLKGTGILWKTWLSTTQGPLGDA